MGSPGAEETPYKVFVGGISWNMTDEGLLDGGRVAELGVEGSAHCISIQVFSSPGSRASMTSVA
jgi:hypothetical protein